jgi:DNA modification methylase
MMLFAPCSNNPDVWTDIVRIKTLNTDLSRKTTENHVCPLQIDVIERLIERFSNPGEVILDPFGGVMSVPYQAIKMRRQGWGVELSSQYHGFGVSYCERAEKKLNAPTLFDMEDMDEIEEPVAAMAEELD